MRVIRVIMVEPQGQGGICHYAYSLCNALSDSESAAITLATGRPYELDAAPRSFDLVTAFGSGIERKLIQAMLRRPDLRQDAQPLVQPSSAARPASVASAVAATQPFQSGSLAGRASRLLAERESHRGWRRVLSLARQQPETVAHIQWLTNPERDARWLAALRACGVLVVFTAHNILPHDAPPETRATWARLYQSADAIIVHYQRALEELASLGLDLSAVSVIPHGNYCAIQALTQGNQSKQSSGDAESRRAAARARLGLAPTAPVVLSFGLMRPYKGIQYLLPAFAALREKLPEARLILAGRAPDGFASVQAEIARLGLQEATLALPTYLPLQQVAEVFEASDLVALPYVEASQSGVIQLAYAYSRPVVATRVGGIPEAVVDGETGALVASRDSGDLARALERLLSDRQQCAAMGMQARRVAEERFAWEPIAAQTAQIYQRLGHARQRDRS